MVKSKVFGDNEERELDTLLMALTEQFNMMRDKQPVVIDSLLEVIEQVKEMKNNYTSNPFLYNYDYVDELKSLVHTRYRIYDVK